MSKSQRWKFLMPFAMVMLFLTAMVSGAWANEFEAVNTLVQSSTLDFTRDGTPGGNTNLTNGSDSITWSNASGNSASAFFVGSTLEVQLPAGLEFYLEDGSASPTTGVIDALVTTGGTTAPTVSPSSLITTQYTDTTGAVVTAVTGFKIPILTAGSNDGYVTIDFNQAGPSAATDITIRPIPSLGAKPMNAKDLQVTVKGNGGTSAETSADLGSLNMLKTPRLTKAILVGSDAVDLYFDVDVDLSTVTQGAGLSLVAGAGGSDFVFSGGGTGDVSVDLSNKKKVMIRNMSVLPSSDGTQNFNVDTANDFIDNDLGAWPSAASPSQNRAVPVVALGTAVTSVTVDKTTVGVNTNGGISYNANLKADNTNKMTVSFEATGGEPFDFRIVNKDTGQLLAVDANNAASVVAGYEIETTTGLAAAGNVVTVPAAQNLVGIVQMTVCFDGVTAVGLTAGHTGTIQIQASTDKFATHTDANVTMDREAPSLVLSGADAAKALSRTQVQFKFDEKMDRTSVERLFVDNGNGVGGRANDGIQNGGEESIYKLRDVTAASFITVKGVSVAADSQTVTLTTDLIPVGDTLQIQVLGAATGGIDGTNRQGAMDLAGNYISNVAGTYTNTNTFQVSGETLASVTVTNQGTRRNFIADGGVLRTEVTGPANLGSVYIRAVDADAPTHILSTVTSALATEVSTGLYRNTTMALTTGITARALVVQASTDITFSTGVITSNEVLVDNTRPKVVSAAYVDPNTCTVTFDEPVWITNAENGVNYSIPGLGVSTTAHLDLTTEKTVTLTTTTMTTGTTYVVDVAAAVQDLAGNGINSAADSLGTDRASFTAGVSTLAVDQSSVALSVGESATVNVSGGVAPYSVSVSGAATATIDGSVVTITGSVKGGATVTVSDSASPASTAVITVTVTPAVAPTAGTSPTLDPQTQLDPTANSVNVTATEKTGVTIAPVLNVPTADQDSTVNLYAAIVIDNQAYVLEAGLFGQGTWALYTGGVLPSMGSATLGATQAFDLDLNNINLTGFTGSFDVYYGYATQADLSDFVGSSYEVTVQ